MEQCLKARLDYIKNGSKTEQGKLISTYMCNADTIDAEFAYSKRKYQQLTGRSNKNDAIAYQIRQSFKPGEVTPEEANRIGYELAERYLKGNHAFIVATHNDTKHIHNHIVWNSTTLDCKRKYRDVKGSAHDVMRLSDEICYAHGLSVVERKVPPQRGMRYNEWLGSKAKPSQRDLLHKAIDDALEQKPVDLDDLLFILESNGWQIKRANGIYLKLPQEKRYKSLNTLGEAYTEAAIVQVLSGTRKHIPQKKTMHAFEMQVMFGTLPKNSSRVQSSWQKQNQTVQEIKNMADALNFLSEHGYKSISDVKKALAEVDAKIAQNNTEIRALDAKLDELDHLNQHIYNYKTNKAVYEEFMRSGRSPRYFSQHKTMILPHISAKENSSMYFNSSSLNKKAIDEEKSNIFERRNKLVAHNLHLQSQRKRIKKSIEIIDPNENR